MKGLKGVFALFILLIGFPFGMLALLWKDRCHRTNVATSRSPSGEWVVETTLVDCGPSMKVATELLLRRDAEKEGETILVMADKVPPTLAWQGDQNLTMTLPPNAEVVKGKTEWQGVKIGVASAQP